MSIRRKLLLAVPLLVLLVVAGCKVNSINYFPPHPASVRVINLMPDAPSIDVQVGGSPAFTGVTFQAATGYQSYNNATTGFSVNLTGSTQPLISFSYPLAGEQPYTLVIFGTTTNPAGALLSEVPSAPTNGNIQLSLFNAAINNSGIDVYVTTPGTDITTVNPNFAGVAYNGATLNLAFAPGTYQIQVTTTGTKTVIYDSGGSALTPNIGLTFVVYSKGSGTLVNAAVLQSQGPTTLLNTIFARIKAVNAAPSPGPVNQLLGTLTVNPNINFASASGYYQGPQGATTVGYEASSTPGATIASVPATLGAATDVSTFITGPSGGLQAYVLNDVNLPPFGGEVRLRFVNASWNSNPVNISVNGTQVATALAFPTASAYVPVIAATTYTITFTDAVTGAVVLTSTPDNTVLVTGFTSTIYLIGPQGAVGALITQDN